MKHTRPQSTNTNQQGFASLAIALVMIVVLALLTVAFAQLSRREQQSALSSQLATAAHVAAESGINDAYSDIKDSLITVATRGADKGVECIKPSDVPSSARTAHQTIDDESGTAYSCLLVNLKPPELNWSNVAAGSSRTVSFATEGGNLDDLTVKWQSARGYTAAPPATSGFPALEARGDYVPIIELRLTPVSATLTRDTLINDTFTVYLYPSQAGSAVTSVAYTNEASEQGKIVATKCDAQGVCSLKINNLVASGSDSHFVAHMLNFYSTSNISFVDAHNVSGTSVVFVDSQALIDVTGRSKDVLKRLQVRVPLTKAAANVPDYVIESQNTCKRLQVRPGATDYVGLTGGTLGATSADPCNSAN